MNKKNFTYLFAGCAETNIKNNRCAYYEKAPHKRWKCKFTDRDYSCNNQAAIIDRILELNHNIINGIDIEIGELIINTRRY